MALITGNPVVVIGLGRFGSAIAAELQKHGRQVLAIDVDRQLVQDASSTLSATIEADATDEEALRQVGVHEMQEAVVAIGQDVEASILVTALLSELGIKKIWAKALSERHGRILERVGASRVVFPEVEMGRMVANDFLTEELFDED